jgi:hypothetical protein
MTSEKLATKSGFKSASGSQGYNKLVNEYGGTNLKRSWGHKNG